MKTYSKEKIKTMSLSERAAALKEDFLERDGDSYVFVSKGPRAGWETLLEKGQALTDFNFRTTGMDLLKQSYALARGSIAPMIEGRRVTIKIIPGSDQSFTDGATVNVATNMFDDTSMTEGQRADIFRGKAIHETCHLKWTDFKAMTPELNSMERSLLNIFEDERIERLCGETFPGYAGFLAASKRYVMDRYYKQLEESGTFAGQDDSAAVVNAVIHMIRFPRSLKDEEIDRWGEPLLRIRNLMATWPSDTTEVVPMAKEAYKIILEYLKENPGEDSSGDGTPGSGNGEGNGQTGQSSGKSSGNNKQQATGNPDAEENLEQLGRQLLSSLAGNPNEGFGEEEMSQCITQNEDAFDEAGELQGSWKRGGAAGRIIRKPRPDKDAYRESYDRIKRWVPRVSEKMKNLGTDRSFVVKGQRNGFLDTARLAEGYQGVQTIYMTTGTVKADRLAVSILIDESGSMYDYEKRSAALDAAVLVAESAKRIPNIALNIFSYTSGDHSLEMTDYGSARRGEVLGGYTPTGGTPTAEAIDETVRITRQRTPDKGILVVVTDGAAQNKQEELASAVKKAENAGLSVIAVGIKYKNILQQTVFRNALAFEDLRRFAPDLGKLIRTTICTMQKKQ